MNSCRGKAARYQPTDAELDTEAKEIFADMKLNNRIEPSASLSSVFLARTAAAALERGL